MNQDTPRYIGYICPSCRQSVIIKRSLFGLAAAPGRFRCPCGKSELLVDFQPRQVQLSVPCLYCGRNHAVSCPTMDFISKKGLAFTCAGSGMTCCAVGEEAPVRRAVRAMEESADKLSADASQRGEFLDGTVMEEVLGEIRDIAARGGISCTCGSKNWTFRVNYSSVDLLCRECGAEMRIPAATADDIDSICCQTKLVLHGRKKQGDG